MAQKNIFPGFFVVFIQIIVMLSIILADGNIQVLADNRGFSATVTINPTRQSIKSYNETIKSYNESHALLIGVSNYIHWPVLEQVQKEMATVKAVLENQGFKVTIIADPDNKTFENAFKSFINKYGFNVDNRLFFYFAGHGHTLTEGDNAYLVPINAPLPQNGISEFKRTALDMNMILAWCRTMDARHILFVFDSCFSGSIFKQRRLPSTSPAISKMAGLPVRQFITAGSANESVPAKSTFTPAFVDALKYGLGDLNGDGYICGTELGLYLQTEVARYTHQTPQYGKINDYELSRGDFIFTVGGGDPSSLSTDLNQSINQKVVPLKKEDKRGKSRMGNEAEAENSVSEIKACTPNYSERPPIEMIVESPYTEKRPSTENIYKKDINGIVYDKSTDLEWYAGPDKPMDWNKATIWVSSLAINGGGWRMPTRAELSSLYKKGAGSRNMTPLIEITGWYVWSGETLNAGAVFNSKDDSAYVWIFDYIKGESFSNFRSISDHWARTFAVRSNRRK
jgi:hypothetical protein